MQFYASPEQIMRDRSEYARKGIARGRSAIVRTYELRTQHRAEASLTESLHLAVTALASIGSECGQTRTLTTTQREIAILDRGRTGRTFRRIVGAALIALLKTPETTTVVKPADTDP